MRKDFLHKLSKSYSENQTVVVEDLKIKNMTSKTKGTIEKPSKNAKAKRGLNRVITQQSWGLFFELLEYKLNEKGGQLLKVDPKFTSQTCLVIDNEMKLKDASCDCWYFGQNKLNKGPCEHILATSSFWRSRR